MEKKRPKKLPEFKSLDHLIEFFDTHDMGDYWDEMPEVRFDMNIKRRTHLIAINDEIAEKLTAIARAQRISSEDLVNAWLKEKILKEAETSK